MKIILIFERISFDCESVGAIVSSSWENIFKFANLRIIMHVTEFPDFLYENGLVVTSFSSRTLVFFTESFKFHDQVFREKYVYVDKENHLEN